MKQYEPTTINELAMRKRLSYIECYRRGWQDHRAGKRSNDGPDWFKVNEYLDWLKGWQAAADTAANPFKIVGFTMRVADKVVA
jgi:ribosome modulation factor